MKIQDPYTIEILKKSKLLVAFGDNPYDTYVIADGYAIGCVQEVFFHIEAENQLDREIKITFPKFDSWNSSKEWSDGAKKIESLGFVNVTYKDLKFENSSTATNKQVEESFVSSSDEDFEESLRMVRRQK